MEAWATENGGSYPGGLSDQTPLGNTVIDLLPGGMLLENPYTTFSTEPCNGAAATPGQTGYVVCIANQTASGYTITGYGCYGVVATIYKDPYSP